MAINVKHGVSAGAVAAAAFAGAAGRRRGAGGNLPRPSAATPQQRAKEAERERAFKAAQTAQAHEWDIAAQQGKFDEAERARQFQAEQSALAHERGFEVRADAFDYSRDAAVGDSELRRQDLEFSLTTRQRQELDQLANAEASAMADPRFTADEKKELRYKFAQRRAGLTPVARPKPPTPAERFRERTHVDPRTGAIFAIDEAGNIGNPIYQPPERLPTVQDRAKAVEVASQLLGGDEGTVDVKSDKFRRTVDYILSGGDMAEAGPADWTRAFVGGQTVGQEQPEAPQQAAAPVVKPQEKPGILARMGRALFGPSQHAVQQRPPLEKIIGNEENPTRGNLEPDEVEDIATAEYQLRVERERLRRADSASAEELKRWETPNIDDKAVRATMSGEDLSAARGKREQRAKLEFRHTKRSNEMKERIKALEARRDKLVEMRDEMQAEALAVSLSRRG